MTSAVKKSSHQHKHKIATSLNFLQHTKLPSMVPTGFEPKVPEAMDNLPQKYENFRAELQAYHAKILQAQRYAKDLAIDTREMANENLAFAGNLRKMQKQIEETKKEITEPARIFVSEINALAKTYTDPLAEAVNVITAKIGNFDAAERAESEKQAILKQIVLEAAGVSFDNSLVVEVTSQKPKAANASTYQTTEYKIEIEDLKLVPVEFLLIDESRVKAAMKSGRESIPGLKISQHTLTRLRTK